MCCELYVVIPSVLSTQLVDEQFKENFDLIRNIVRLNEGPDGALEIKIKRNDSEANGWQTALSQKKVSFSICILYSRKCVVSVCYNASHYFGVILYRE